MKKLASFIVLAFMLVLCAAPVYASGIPALPHAFYGTVTINDSPAPPGTTVLALGEGVVTGISGNPVVTTVSGIYGTSNPLEPRLIVQGDIQDGAPIAFYVNGVSTGLTASWHSGKVTELNLFVTITPPETPTEPGPTGPAVTTVSISGFTATVPLQVDAQGIVQASTTLTTADGKLSLFIAKGTKMLDAQGNPLKSITATPMTTFPSPPPGGTIVLAYDLGPSGATFVPPLTLTMSYDPLHLPEGVTESNLSIAYWNGTSWLVFETTVNTEAHTLSCQVSHFTIFAVLAVAPQPPPTTTPPTTTPPTTTPPTTTPPTTTPPTTTPTDWPLIGGIIGGAIVAGLLVYLMVRRRA